jgi:hypothetical protein
MPHIGGNDAKNVGDGIYTPEYEAVNPCWYASYVETMGQNGSN